MCEFRVRLTAFWAVVIVFWACLAEIPCFFLMNYAAQYEPLLLKELLFLLLLHENTVVKCLESYF